MSKDGERARHNEDTQWCGDDAYSTMTAAHGATRMRMVHHKMTTLARDSNDDDQGAPKMPPTIGQPGPKTPASQSHAMLNPSGKHHPPPSSPSSPSSRNPSTKPSFPHHKCMTMCSSTPWPLQPTASTMRNDVQQYTTAIADSQQCQWCTMTMWAGNSADTQINEITNF